MFTLIWIEISGDEPTIALAQHEHVEAVFRAFHEIVGHNNTEWRFDGDGFHTDMNQTYDGEKGGWLITRF